MLRILVANSKLHRNADMINLITMQFRVGDEDSNMCLDATADEELVAIKTRMLQRAYNLGEPQILTHRFPPSRRPASIPAL